jgi:quaternary ammonium compound-resistance protein SugE
MSQGVAWLLLVVSGLLDVAWAVAMKLTHGYTRPGWTALSLVLLAAFVWLLGRVLTVLPVGSAYAVWTGIGAAGTVLLGVALFGETLSAPRVIGVALVVAGIVALKQAPA